MILSVVAYVSLYMLHPWNYPRNTIYLRFEVSVPVNHFVTEDYTNQTDMTSVSCSVRKKRN